MKNFKWKLTMLIPVLAGIAVGPAKGMPLLETNNFKIHASRRETPGSAEIHTRDTDIVYMQD